MITKHFKAELKSVDDMDATIVEIPFNIKDVFGTSGQVKVKARIDGVLYRGSLANMGFGCHTLGITKKVRAEIGKNSGDMVDIILEEDTEPRLVEIPDDLVMELKKHPAEEQFYNSLSYTNRKEYVVWVESAKKEETRQHRVLQTIEKLKLKLKNPSAKA